MTSSLAQIADSEGLPLAMMAVVPLDIALIKDDAAIQPDGPVEVTVDIPEGMDPAKVAVYHIADDGSATKMPGHITISSASAPNPEISASTPTLPTQALTTATEHPLSLSASSLAASTITPTAYTFTTTHFSKYTVVAPGDVTYSAATTLTSASKGATLNARTVYTIDGDTTIEAAKNQNGLIVSTATDENNPAVLFIPGGTTLTVKGGAGTDGGVGKAGILLQNGDYLYVRGAGKLRVTGGVGSVLSETSHGNGGPGYALKIMWTIYMFGGYGGWASSGGSGGGAGIGTDGGAAGAKPPVDPQSLTGSSVSWSALFNSGNSREHRVISGMNGLNGNNGGNSNAAGTLYVLDTVSVSGTGGSGGREGARGAGSDNQLNYVEVDKDENPIRWLGDMKAGGGGGAGGAGSGGSGVAIGSGGAGGGSGGCGGGGGAALQMGEWIKGDFPSGEGGKGGEGAGVTADGEGTRGVVNTIGGTSSGGTGGKGGKSGASAAGGALFVANTASFWQNTPEEYVNVHGKPATTTEIDVSKNSQYDLTFDTNRPTEATGTLTYTGAQMITVTAGVPYVGDTFSPTLTGWRFLGWYTHPSAGVPIVDEYGRFIMEAGGGAYTTYNGVWCYPDDMRLYAHWEPRIYVVALNTMMSGVPDPSATTVIYEKYDIGWYADEAAIGPKIDTVTPPIWGGYTFGGYFTGANGADEQAIAADGSILLPEKANAYADHKNLLAKWDPTPYRVAVKLNLDGVDIPYTQRNVGLYQYGTLRYTLAENAPGVYNYYVPLDDISPAARGVVGGAYNLWVDGVDTGRTLTVNQADNEDTVLTYYTAVVCTPLDGTPTDTVGDVTLRRDGAIIARPAFDPAANDGNGAHTAAILFDETPDADNTCAVYVGSENTDFVLEMSEPDERAATVPYYTATLNLIYDAAWENASVTLRQNGAVKHYLAFDESSNAANDNTNNTYKKILRGDLATQSDPVADSYDIFVGGANAFASLQIDEIGLSANQTMATVEYYIATVNVNKDAQPWTNTGVELWQNGSRVYTLTYDGTAHAYTYPYVLKRTDGENTDALGIHVAGSISGADTGQTLSETSPSTALTYWSVTYEDRNTEMLTQVVANGGTAARPGDPYHVGITFIEWRTLNFIDGPAYDFDTAVTTPLRLYAAYEAPSILISGYIKCYDSGEINGLGGYYRMVNLSINGYPRTGTPLNAAILHVTNGEVQFTENATANYTVYDNTDAASGDGTVTIIFKTEQNENKGISMAAAQKFLRENVIVKVKDSEEPHTMKVYVYGNTN
jgi:hypothetical protein